jgi:rfaE bifunctional protein kinase chain/domain
LLERYSHKIKSVQDLCDIVGPRPRDKRVIMCHGVFDVVHPGHICHLLYAKSKADVLVASVTADRYVDKGVYRPLVPQDLRAVNLAAFEMVDYVIIDDHAEPLSAMALIKPDYFCKGFEYNGSPAKTKREVDIVHGYGGEIIFSPGDIVYSSSRLIDLAPPDIKYAKLQALMERAGVTFDRLRGALRKMADFRVHVVGDTIIDTITHANLIGASNKTPTLSVRVERTEHFVGGAAVVAKHIRAAGARVALSTVLGSDRCGDLAVGDLLAAGIGVYCSVDVARPTTNKNAVVVGGYRLIKLDTVDNRPISERTVAELKRNLAEVPADAVIFSDFRHGIFNRDTIEDLVHSIPDHCLAAADSQVASRWGNILDFKGFDLITPNEREARFASGDQDSVIRSLALNLYRAARCKCLILKLGGRGVLTQAKDESFVVDSFADHVVDPVGAGDALLAYATLGLLVPGERPSSPVAIATILGVFAAGVACERDGNVPVTADSVAAKIDSVERQIA